MRRSMHPALLDHLKQNNINVGEDLDSLNGRFEFVLRNLTGVNCSGGADAFRQRGYCLTGDSLLKMMAIYMRVRCGLPVVCIIDVGALGHTMFGVNKQRGSRCNNVLHFSSFFFPFLLLNM